MRILYIGDTHGDFRHLNILLSDKVNKYDIAIVLGDFGYWPGLSEHFGIIERIKVPEFKQLYFVDGNHENHDELQRIVKEQGWNVPIEMHRRVYYLPRGCWFTIRNLNFLAVGGADSIDKNLRIEGRDWFKSEIPNYAEMDRSLSHDIKINVVLSHTVPSLIANELRQNRYKMEEPTNKFLDAIWNKYKPSRWYFGHWHQYYNKTYDGCTFYGLNMTGRTNSWRIDEA